MCVGICAAVVSPTRGAVVLELARPGLGDRDGYSDGGHAETLQNPVAAPISPRERIDRVSDTFRAAQARSDAIEEQMAKDPGLAAHADRGPSDRGAAHRPLLRLDPQPPPPPGQRRRDLAADRGLPGHHRPRGRRRHRRQRAQPAARQHRRRPRPREGDDLHALLGARAQPADAALPQPGQRRRAAAQPHRQGRGQVGRHHLDRRAAAHLPRPPGRRHPVLQGQRRPGRPRPAPPPRADPRRRAPLQRPLRPRLPRARRPAVRGAADPRHRRHQDEQVQGQRRRAADERRRDRQEAQGRQDRQRPGHHLRPGRPARGRQPAHPHRASARASTRLRSPRRSATAAAARSRVG